jgi:hypothetical protein
MAYRVPSLHEVPTLSGFFLIEEWSIRILLNVVSGPYGWKGFSDINFNHSLFEIVIYFEQERDSWLLLVQGLETSSMLFQGVR